MSKFLSIIVPSNRPVGFQKLWDSLIRNTANIQDIEVIKLVDSYLNGVTSDPILKIVEQIPTIPLNMSELNTICYEHSTGQWIMLANDDCEMQTPGWDVLLRKAVSLYPDEVALFYPNDGMFGDKLACFPIISRKVIEATKLLPMKYRRYKQDDTIFGMFPANRRVYLENIRFQHFNNKATEGFHLPEGGIYPIDKAAAEYDNRIWFSENTRRQELALKIRELIGIQD